MPPEIKLGWLQVVWNKQVGSQVPQPTYSSDYQVGQVVHVARRLGRERGRVGGRQGGCEQRWTKVSRANKESDVDNDAKGIHILQAGVSSGRMEPACERSKS